MQVAQYSKTNSPIYLNSFFSYNASHWLFDYFYNMANPNLNTDGDAMSGAEKEFENNLNVKNSKM
jgi:hypothetical protein